MAPPPPPRLVSQSGYRDADLSLRSGPGTAAVLGKAEGRVGRPNFQHLE